MSLKTGVHKRDRRSVALDGRYLVVGMYSARCTQPIDERGASIGNLVDVDGATETNPGFAWTHAMRPWGPSVIGWCMHTRSVMLSVLVSSSTESPMLLPSVHSVEAASRTRYTE